METNHYHPAVGNTSAVISILSFIFTWISTKEMQSIITLIAGCIAILAGVFTIIYTHYGIKERKQNLRNNEK